MCLSSKAVNLDVVRQVSSRTAFLKYECCTFVLTSASVTSASTFVLICICGRDRCDSGAFFARARAAASQAAPLRARWQAPTIFSENDSLSRVNRRTERARAHARTRAYAFVQSTMADGAAAGRSSGGAGGDPRPSVFASAKSARHAVLLATQAVSVNEAALLEARENPDAIRNEFTRGGHKIWGLGDRRLLSSKPGAFRASPVTGTYWGLSRRGSLASREHPDMAVHGTLCVFTTIPAFERMHQALLLITGALGVTAAAVRKARAEALGLTDTMLAAGDGDVDRLRRLLDAGADADEPSDHNGWTALMFATYDGSTDCVKTLLDAGADADKTTSEYGWTALILAADKGFTDCVKTLLDAGADVDKTTRDGWTALTFAARDGHTDCVKTLLDAGADADKTSEYGWTALMLAADNGFTDCVKTLLDAGADADKTRTDGWTALMLAARGRRVDSVRALLRAGAHVTIATDAGLTALKIAETPRRPNAEVVALLRAAQPPLPYDDSNDEWAEECRSEYDSDDSNAENHPDNDFPEEQDSDWDDDIFGGMGMRIEGATHGGSGRGGVDHGVGGDDSEDDVDGHNDGND